MYSWHKDFYHKAFNKTSSSVMKKLAAAELQLVDFWTWVEANYTEAYRKYTLACDRISSLCKDNTPQGMESFKQSVQQEMQGLEYFIDQYILKFKIDSKEEAAA